MTQDEGGSRERDRALVEAALFLADKPVSRKTLSGILSGASSAYVDLLLTEIRDDLSHPDRGLELVAEGDKLLFQVKREHLPSVAHLAPQQDIPRPVLRTLAVIAYNHPATQSAVVKARGNKAYEHIRALVERGLIRTDEQGRTLLLSVTDEFLDYFGLASVEEFRLQAAPSPSPASAPDREGIIEA